MKIKKKLFIIFFSLFVMTLAAEEEPAASSAQHIEEIEEDEPLPPSMQRIEMEIRTSTLSELAVWCRSLGLSEGGTREDLSTRIRDYFQLPHPQPPDSNRKEIIIESAQTIEYFTVDVIDEDYARLTGDVRLSLRDGDATHRVSANEIIFNRTRNILSARGNVFYEKHEGDSIETFRGQNITVNIDTWSSVFLDGNTIHELEDDGTAYLFSGAVISRSDEDVTILNDARITNAVNEEALWSITASRLWLLPGSDFAIFNAVLWVGEIPVFYFPFFYLPADRLVFHPVIGYRTREGGFVQTTTYIFGQPKADQDEVSSISRILGVSDNMELEPQGLFLRSTGRMRVDPNELSLKLLLDYYVNLGAYVGIELAVPRTGILNPLKLSLGLGFTRTVTSISSGYTPYAPNYDGTFDWNESNLFSIPVPFRYRMRLESSINTGIGTFSWNLPYYSDPYVDYDFLNRSENMDFVHMIQQGPASNQGASTQNEIGSYQWHISGNLTPSFPNLTPFISRIAITNLSMTLAFKTMRDDNVFNTNRNAPERFFYAPDKFTIYSFSGTISGTPLTFNSGQRAPEDAPVQRDNPLEDIGIPISPWPDESPSTERVTPSDDLAPPVLSQNFNMPAAGNTRFIIDYQITPTSFSELQFMSSSSNWPTYKDVDWGDVQSILTSVGGRSDINFRFNHTTGLFTNVATLSGNGTFRDYTYLNEEAEIFLTNGETDQNKIDAARRQQYSQTNYSTSYAYSGTLRPFAGNEIFGQSNFQYTLRGTLVRSQRYSTGDGPELTPIWGTWAKDERSRDLDIPGITNHRLTTAITASIMDRNQTMNLSADLPPLDGMISANATFRFWISETNISLRMDKPDESGEWIYRPVSFTETLSFGNISRLIFNIVIDPQENNEITSIRSSITLWDFRTEFSARKTAQPVFVLPSSPGEHGGWRTEGEQKLLPSALTFSYNRNFSDNEIIPNRFNLSFNIRTSLNFDLLQHTNSNFQLTFGLTMKITGFLDLTISATTENAVIFRYFKGIPGMEELTIMYPEGPQNNLLLDLFDSFNFFDDAIRRRAGFKMQRFNLTAAHYLGDWTAEFDVSMSPYRNTLSNPVKYEIATNISFTVKWKPISEFQSNIRYDGRNDGWIIE